jgi:hypothetical protein
MVVFLIEIGKIDDCIELWVCWKIETKAIGNLYSMQIGFREIRHSYFYSQQSKKQRCNRLLQSFLMML